MSGELLLVGGISPRYPERCLRNVRAAAAADTLFAIPDGEVGPRRHWICRVHSDTLAAHPELEVVQRPAPDRENGVERQHPRGAADAWWFKVKDGVGQGAFRRPRAGGSATRATH